MEKEEFDKAFEECFPDFKEGEYYDFSHKTVSKENARRYQEVGGVIEAPLADNEHFEISGKTCRFLYLSFSKRQF